MDVGFGPMCPTRIRVVNERGFFYLAVASFLSLIVIVANSVLLYNPGAFIARDPWP